MEYCEVNKKEYDKVTYEIFCHVRQSFLDPKHLYVYPKNSGIKNTQNILFSPLMFIKDTSDVNLCLHKRQVLYNITMQLSKNNSEDQMTCIGTGCIEDNSIMVVGMAPGFYNASKFDDVSKPFKPSLYFSNTSRILRFGFINYICDIYFTNLSKIVTTRQKMKYRKYFNKHVWAFKKQLDIIKPRMIICLGNDVYKFLNDKYNIVKMYHPSYFIYKNRQKQGIEYYKKIMEEINDNCTFRPMSQR